MTPKEKLAKHRAQMSGSESDRFAGMFFYNANKVAIERAKQHEEAAANAPTAIERKAARIRTKEQQTLLDDYHLRKEQDPFGADLFLSVHRAKLDAARAACEPEAHTSTPFEDGGIGGGNDAA